MNNCKKIIADSIKRNTIAKFKTQSEAARTIGVDRREYSHWATGRIAPRAENLDKIADVLDIPVAYLLCTPQEQEALYIGMQIQANPDILKLVELATQLSADDLTMVTRMAQISANQN